MVPGWLLAQVLQLCTYLDLMLKFFPRETCLMDLLLPMESTSVTMSGSKPVKDRRHPLDHRGGIKGGPPQKETCRATEL